VQQNLYCLQLKNNYDDSGRLGSDVKISNLATTDVTVAITGIIFVVVISSSKFRVLLDSLLRA